MKLILQAIKSLIRGIEHKIENVRNRTIGDILMNKTLPLKYLPSHEHNIGEVEITDDFVLPVKNGGTGVATKTDLIRNFVCAIITITGVNAAETTYLGTGKLPRTGGQFAIIYADKDYDLSHLNVSSAYGTRIESDGANNRIGGQNGEDLTEISAGFHLGVYYFGKIIVLN